MSLQKVHERLIKAIAESEKMTADQFTQTATIIHEDESSFRCTECKVSDEGELVVVYCEHGHPLVFYREDLASVYVADRQPPC